MREVKIITLPENHLESFYFAENSSESWNEYPSINEDGYSISIQAGDEFANVDQNLFIKPEEATSKRWLRLKHHETLAI